MEVGSTSYLLQECGYCGAERGQDCTTLPTQNRTRPHAARRSASHRRFHGLDVFRPVGGIDPREQCGLIIARDVVTELVAFLDQVRCSGDTDPSVDELLCLMRSFTDLQVVEL